MIFDPATGILSGTTPVCGTFDFTLQLTDSSPIPLTFQKAYQLNVVCSNDYDLAGNVGVTGVTVALTGTSVQTVTSGTGGAYLFQHLTNGSYTVTPTKTGYWFTPGSKSVTINNLDMAGVTFTATADSTPPTGSIIINGGAKYARLRDVTLGLTAADVGSGVVAKMQFSANGGPWSTPENYIATKPWTLSTGDGAKTIAVKYLDKAGNWSDVYSATITLDTVNPETTITTKPVPLSNTRSPSFSFTSTDPDSTFECQLDSGVFALCPSPKVYSGLMDGSHTINVRAIDGAGNIDPTPATYTWTIDATPPPITITGKPANPTRLQTATFAFGSTDATATLECALDAGSLAPCNSPVTYNTLTEGSHTFQVRGTDPATNTTTISYTWRVDLTPPDTIIDSKPAVMSGSATATFAFSATEAGSTFACQLDGGGFIPCTSPKNYTPLEVGSHTFAVRATDAAGNPDSTPATYTWEQGVNLKVTYAGTGGGTVAGDTDWQPVTGTSTQAVGWNSGITLSALANGVSTFDGWGGDCSGKGTCKLTMTTDKVVTSTFSRAFNARIGVVGYGALTDAYQAAVGGATIMALDTELMESFTLSRGIGIILKGGYKADYSGKSGNPTVLKGTLTIGAGSLIVDGLAVR